LKQAALPQISDYRILRHVDEESAATVHEIDSSPLLAHKVALRQVGALGLMKLSNQFQLVRKLWAEDFADWS
jgi:hypothetical protein